MNTSNPQAILQNIADAELALLKGPLLAFSQSLQQPGANILTLQNEIANLGLALPAEAGPAQTAALNIVGANLEALIATIGTPAPSPAPAPAPTPAPAPVPAPAPEPAPSSSGSGSGSAAKP